MGKKKTQRTENVHNPIGLVFNVSTLAASLSVLQQLAVGESDLYRILLRALFVFMGFAVAGSIIVIAATLILHRARSEQVAAQAPLLQQTQEHHTSSYSQQPEAQPSQQEL